MIASNQTFIIAAYALTWVVLLGYLVVLVRKGQGARAEYDRMAHDHERRSQP